MRILKRRSDAIYLTEMGAFIARRINYWDGGHWRDHGWWKQHYEWRGNRWHPHGPPPPPRHHKKAHHDHHGGHGPGKHHR
ncbi:hypothetical protein GQE32_22785 [Escherichia coli]|nr:hypothetical protein [Escherichia coli]